MYPGSPFNSSEQILKAYLRGCLQGLSLQSPLSKIQFSTFRLCIFSIKRGMLKTPRMANSRGLEIYSRIPISC